MKTLQINPSKRDAGHPAHNIRTSVTEKSESKFKPLLLVCLIGAIVASACGGKSGSDTADSQTPASSAQGAAVSLEVAQTHVVAPQGLTWPLEEAGDLKTVAARDVLVLAHGASGSLIAPKLEVWQGKVQLGKLALAAPDKLPVSEGGEQPYAKKAWSAVVPGKWVQLGLVVRVVDGARDVTDFVPISVAPEVDVTFQLLPMALFGATKEHASVMGMTDNDRAQAAAGMPFSTTKIVDHPLGSFESSYFIVPPDKGLAAAKVFSSEELKFNDRRRNILDFASTIHNASGDRLLNKVNYAGVTMLNSKKERDAYWGGVAYIWSGVGVGDFSPGLLWHEGGHAMSLSHSPEAALGTPPTYPYAVGSLKGSAWGFDQANNYFRSPLTTPNSFYATCSATDVKRAMRGGQPFQQDANGRCYRFDPMHSAEDAKDPKAVFPLYSDFNSAKMLKWAHSRTRLNAAGTGLERLDAAQAWVPYQPVTKDAGQWGLFSEHPVLLNKQLDLVYVTHSLAGTPDVSQFFNPIRHTGNSVATIDPMDGVSLQKIYPDQINNKWMEYDRYCKNSGCDFTVKATYQDGTTAYRILQGSQRESWKPDVWKAKATDPKDSESFLQWAVNLPVPANGSKIQKLELLNTPKVWGMTTAAIAAAPPLATLAVK